MRILAVGDVLGKLGRMAVADFLPDFVKQENIDFIVLNGENSAGGLGITPDIVKFYLDLGVDVITSGNHIWHKKEIYKELDDNPYILRPLNYPEGVPGHGYVIKEKKGLNIAVINLEGRVFMPSNLDCPFRTVDKLLKKIDADITLIDFHAEATSEKLALAYFLDGKITALWGTHTHVQTADERILPLGTGYITDIGMVGPLESVIGMDKETIIKKFLLQMPTRIKSAKGSVIFNGIVIDIDLSNFTTFNISRISRII